MIPLYGCKFLKDSTQLETSMLWVQDPQLFYNESDADEYGASTVKNDIYVYEYQIIPFYIEEVY